MWTTNLEIGAWKEEQAMEQHHTLPSLIHTTVPAICCSTIMSSVQRVVAAVLVTVALAGAPPARAESYFTGDARAAARQEVARLKAIQARHEADLLARPGVFGMGISLDRASGQLVFQVLVDPQAPLPPLPQAVEGVPLVVRRKERPHPQDGGCNSTTPCHDNQQSLPVAMGNSGKTGVLLPNCRACTLGFKACDPKTGDFVYVTNAHCTDDVSGCEGTAAIGASTYHVSPADTPSPTSPNCTLESVVGSVSRHATPVCGVNNIVDASKIISGGSLTLFSIRDIGVPSPLPGTALPGDEVQKSGRTTGYTTGVVAAVNDTVIVSPYCCGAATFVNQIEVDATAGDWTLTGDSGAAVLNFQAPPAIVGLHFAGAGLTGWANPIDVVLARLGLSLNLLDCIAAQLCPASEAAKGTADPASTVGRLYQFENVLGGSELGKEYIRLFYAVATDWLRLYAANSNLLLRTQQQLQADLDILTALASRQPVTIPASRLNGFDQLLAAHITAAGDHAELKAAFRRWRQDLKDPQIQRLFGVTVSQ